MTLVDDSGRPLTRDEVANLRSFGPEGQTRREATCKCCRRNDAPAGGDTCGPCAEGARAVAAGIFRAMHRGCMRWDEYEKAFIHKTGTPSGGPDFETVDSPRRLAEIGREH